MITVYHGSNEKFSRFKMDYMGKNGTENGFGIYFTDVKDEAKGFGKYVYECQLNIRKLISDTKITLRRPTIQKLLDNLIKYECNYYQNFDNNKRETLNSLFEYSQTDTEIIGDIVNAVGNTEAVLTELSKLGYSHTIAFDDYYKSTHFVMFDVKDIKILSTDTIEH